MVRGGATNRVVVTGLGPVSSIGIGAGAFSDGLRRGRSGISPIRSFDTTGFPDIGSRSTQEFQRVRGGLLLAEIPRDYNHRYFWLIQDDRLTFGDVTTVDNRKNNIYTKFAYQYGTQFDEHLNSIVGESRGRIIPVLTAFRELGPQKLSISAAITQAARFSTGEIPEMTHLSATGEIEVRTYQLDEQVASGRLKCWQILVAWSAHFLD